MNLRKINNGGGYWVLFEFGLEYNLLGYFDYTSIRWSQFYNSLPYASSSSCSHYYCSLCCSTYCFAPQTCCYAAFSKACSPKSVLIC